MEVIADEFGRAVPRMVTEKGQSVLTVKPEDVTTDSFVGVGTLLISGETADFAVEAIGQHRRLFIDGKEYRLVDVRLEEVS